MFKLVVLSAVLALAAGKPGLFSPLALSAPVVSSYSVPSIAVSHVPTAISSQSSSVVHSTGTIVTPIVTPIHKTIIAAPAPIAVSPLAISPLSLHAYSPLSLNALSGWNQPIQSW